MPTKTTIYGRNFNLKINTVTIENVRAKGLTQARDTRETTTADSADNEESVATIMRRGLTFGFLASEGTTTGAGFIALQGFYEAGDPVAWELSRATGGTRKWSGSATLTKLDFDIPYDGNVEVSGELKPTGVVTFGIS
jgi:predicted secreted protein